MTEVAVLFVRQDSTYKRLPGCQCYDVNRNALTFPGGMPVVCHPPCRTWGSLRAFAKAPPDEPELAVWAVGQVRAEGGVLEHPAHSRLWRHLQMPEAGWLPDAWGGYTIEVDQFHWGHLARKRTWLYVCGCPYEELPPMPTRSGSPSHNVSSLSGRRGLSPAERRAHPSWKPELGPNRRNKTPPAFAKWLCAVARAAAQRQKGAPMSDFLSARLEAARQRMEGEHGRVADDGRTGRDKARRAHGERRDG